jgi:hypothetical protein
VAVTVIQCQGWMCMMLQLVVRVVVAVGGRWCSERTMWRWLLVAKVCDAHQCCLLLSSTVKR